MPIKITHFLNKMFNISHHEWSRVIFCFLIKSILQIIFVIGSTLLIAMFVEQYHIESLPYLYIIMSVFVIFGSLIFGLLINESGKLRFLIWLSVFSVFIISGVGLFLGNSNIFYILLIFFVSVCVTQLNIVLGLFIEELFSPLEAERTLPFIEASEPIGGIIAGIILVFGGKIVAPETFFTLIFVLLVFLMFFLSCTIYLNQIPRLISREDEDKTVSSRFGKMRMGFRHIKGIKYLKGLAIVVLLQFALFSLIEFQYTSAVDGTIERSDHVEQSYDAHSYSAQLAHSLGFWHVMFSVFLFISQTFIISRVTEKKGIIATMTLHPILMLIPGIGLLSFFSLASTIFTKASFEVLGGMHRTAYHSSFYAIKSSIREHVKESMEGIIRPLGLFLGTIILIVLGIFFKGELLHNIISVFILIILVAMIRILYKTKARYTAMSKRNLENSLSIGNKINAIEVLTQKGHEGASLILGQILKKEEFPEMKEKILNSLSRIGSTYSVPDILGFITDKSKVVQITALKALTNFKDIGENIFTEAFAEYRIASSLKTLMEKTKSREVKSLCIKAFTIIKHQNLASFLIKMLDEAPVSQKADIIYIFKYFNDISIAFYIEKYLCSKDVSVKSSAIITLWQFKSYRLHLIEIICKMFRSKSKPEILAAIYILGEIKSRQEINTLFLYLDSKDEQIRMESAIAIAKIGHIRSVKHILFFLVHEDKIINLEVKAKISKLPKHILNHIHNLLVHDLSQKINQIIASNKTNKFEDLNEKDLEDLIHYYGLLDEEREVVKIKYILKKKTK